MRLPLSVLEASSAGMETPLPVTPTAPKVQKWTRESSDRVLTLDHHVSAVRALMLSHSDRGLRTAVASFHDDASSIQLGALLTQHSVVIFRNNFHKLRCAITNFPSFQFLMFMVCV